MEVTLVHPDNKEQKVVVTNEQQFAAYSKSGFVQVETPAKQVKKEATKTVSPDDKKSEGDK